VKASPSHVARRELFQRGIRRGSLTVREIEGAFPRGYLDHAERWILYYSISAAGISILDDDGVPIRAPDIRPAG
jgi:hypothetical protein